MEKELHAAPLADEPPPPICGWVGDERVGRTCCHGEDYRRRRHEKVRRLGRRRRRGLGLGTRGVLFSI
jgi:hypothetical protein